MANLKNITELPVAESADGLNLIVNDNGVAKQIAASEVGAQADWTETNETSASFIKNKPDNILTYNKNNPPAGVNKCGVFGYDFILDASDKGRDEFFWTWEAESTTGLYRLLDEKLNAGEMPNILVRVMYKQEIDETTYDMLPIVIPVTSVANSVDGYELYGRFSLQGNTYKLTGTVLESDYIYSFGAMSD